MNRAQVSSGVTRPRTSISSVWPPCRAHPSGVASKRVSRIVGSAARGEQLNDQILVAVRHRGVQRGLPLLLDRHVGAGLRIHVEAERDQRRHRVAVAPRRRPDDQPGPHLLRPGHDLGIGGAAAAVGCQHRGDERRDGVEAGAGGAPLRQRARRSPRCPLIAAPRSRVRPSETWCRGRPRGRAATRHAIAGRASRPIAAVPAAAPRVSRPRRRAEPATGRRRRVPSPNSNSSTRWSSSSPNMPVVERLAVVRRRRRLRAAGGRARASADGGAARSVRARPRRTRR